MTLIVIMLKDWGSKEYTWLHAGKEYELDRSFAEMLMSTGKARFTGSADQLFKQPDYR